MIYSSESGFVMSVMSEVFVGRNINCEIFEVGGVEGGAGVGYRRLIYDFRRSSGIGRFFVIKVLRFFIMGLRVYFGMIVRGVIFGSFGFILG